MRAELLPQAEEDLDFIAILIARRDGVSAALAFIDRLRDFALGLADHPYVGTRLPHLGDGVRKIGFRKQATVYFFDQNETVNIARITYAGAKSPARL